MTVTDEIEASAPPGESAPAGPAPEPPQARHAHRTESKPKRTSPRWVRVATGFGALLAVIVALIGAGISYFTLQLQAAAYFHHKVFGVDVSYAYPALVDTLILCCTLLYVGGVRRGNANPWYRAMAWAGIVATVYLNAVSANGQGVIWHVVPPAVWGALVEAAAWDARGQRRREQIEEPLDVIPKRLWLSDPLGTARLWVYMAMTHTTDYVVARRSVSLVEDAMDAIRCEIPGWSFKPRRARRRIRAKLRRGTLTPDEVLDALGVTDPRIDAEGQLVPRTIDEILQRVHRYVLGERPEPARAPRPRAPRQPHRAPTARPLEPAPRADETTERAPDETTAPNPSALRAEEARQGIHEPHEIPARSGGGEFPHDAARQGVYDEYVRRAVAGVKQLTGRDLAAALGMSEGNGRKVIQQFERIRADQLSAAAAAELPAAVPAPTVARDGLDEERAWDELAGDLESREAAPVG